MNIIDFAKTIGKLKTTKRAGWVVEGLKNTESVADHVTRVAALALVAGDELGVNTQKLVNMALVHDLAESEVGDIIAESWGVANANLKAAKYKAEKEAISKLFKGMKNGQKFINLWQEFEEQKTAEAKILRQLDKFEMVLQALEYEQSGEARPGDLDGFWVSAKHSITHPVIKKWLEQIEKERRK